MIERYLTRRDVSHMYDLTMRSLYKWQEDDHIKLYKTPGGMGRVLEAELRQMLDLPVTRPPYSPYNYLRSPQATKKYDVTKRTLATWEKQGYLEVGYTPVGKRWRILEQDLRRTLGCRNIAARLESQGYDPPTPDSVPYKNLSRQLGKMLKEVVEHCDNPDLANQARIMLDEARLILGPEQDK